jgi:hypothetical protein
MLQPDSPAGRNQAGAGLSRLPSVDRCPDEIRPVRTMTQLRWTSCRASELASDCAPAALLAYRRTAQSTALDKRLLLWRDLSGRNQAWHWTVAPAAMQPICGRRLAADYAQLLLRLPLPGRRHSRLCTSTLRWRLARTAQAQHGLCTNTLRHMGQLRSTAWRAHTSMVPGCREELPYTETHTWETLGLGLCRLTQRTQMLSHGQHIHRSTCQPWGPRSTCQ